MALQPCVKWPWQPLVSLLCPGVAWTFLGCRLLMEEIRHCLSSKRRTTILAYHMLCCYGLKESRSFLAPISLHQCQLPEFAPPVNISKTSRKNLSFSPQQLKCKAETKPLMKISLYLFAVGRIHSTASKELPGSSSHSLRVQVKGHKQGIPSVGHLILPPS